jgi:hypothetical protein
MEERALASPKESASQFQMLLVEKYSAESQQVWDNFVARSNCASFLFYRRYMDYHRDRFEDHSLMIFDKTQTTLLAVLPACRLEHNLHSHAGLTFGGLIVPASGLGISQIRRIFDSIRLYLSENAFRSLYYAACPDYFEYQHSQADEHALIAFGAENYRVDTSFVIDLNQQDPTQGFSSRRKRGISKASKLGYKVIEMEDFSQYWGNILIPNLKVRFGSNPVHSIEEIHRIKYHFPDQVRLFVSELNGSMTAGVVIYDCGITAHCQYISANSEGKDTGALDFLISHLLLTFREKNYRYFSLGTANEDSGRLLNEGLCIWKEEFGSRVFAHRFYRLGARIYDNTPE